MLTIYPLPTATNSFVGRAEELASISGLLADAQCRLLTLLGPGGIGKTRLALQAATDQLPYFEDGVFFAPLNSVTSPDLIASAVASALQLPFFGSDEIVRYLREKQMLLVLDNFEHLLDGAALLSEILQTAPGVKLLVTSRERLNLQEEWVIALDGLATPNGGGEPLENFSAVQLFVQRARQVQANFSLSENAVAVRTICHQVEGMPLGLELAASWLRIMSCAQIAAHMESSLDFLTTPLRNVPERHRSLRAVFEQSWSLLSPAEKDALMRLSIFRGGFDLEGAEQVAGASLPAGASLALLAGLADKSLIRLHADGRYDLHELLRQYAADKLAVAGQVNAAADQHLRYYMTLAEQAEAHVWGREQQGWYDRLETELDNLRAALTWSLAGGDAEMGLRLVAALGWLFVERSRPNEGLAWYKRLLAANEGAPALVRAKALNHASEIAGLMTDEKGIEAFGREALALARSVNDRRERAWALSNMGYYTHLKRKPDPSERAMLEESMTLFRELDDVMGLNHTLRRCAQMLTEQGDYEAARPLLEEALTSARESGDQTAIAQSYLSLGGISHLRDHDLTQAAEHYHVSLDLFRELRNRPGMIYALSNLGEIEQLAGNDQQAVTLYREALALLREFAPDLGTCDFLLVGMARSAQRRGRWKRAAILIGSVEHVFKDYDLDEVTIKAQFWQGADLREQLGEQAFDEAFAAGKAMTKAEIIAYALQEDAPSEMKPVERRDEAQTSQIAPQPLIDALTERELEILRLVAAGRSNREIAAELYLALGTVKWYLNTINSKLGVTSRTQAVARGREIGLIP